jgi:hypothetical protein
MSEKNHPTSVGYGRPPVHSQFRRGQSGNPNGRPKKRPTFSADLADELNELVPVGEGQAICVTRQRALVKKLMSMALDGDMKAANLVLSLSSQDVEEGRSEEPAAIDQEILEVYSEQQAGKVEPVALPAPQPSSEGGK